MQSVYLSVGKLSSKIVRNLTYCITKNLVLVSVIRFLKSIDLHVG